MLRTPTGYATITDPDRPLVERDTVSCGHCQRVIFVQPRTAATTYLVVDRRSGQLTPTPGAACRVCMRPVCLACDALGRCLPWEAQLAQSEARDRLARAVLGG